MPWPRIPLAQRLQTGRVHPISQTELPLAEAKRLRIAVQSSPSGLQGATAAARNTCLRLRAEKRKDHADVCQQVATDQPQISTRRPRRSRRQSQTQNDKFDQIELPALRSVRR